MHRHVRSISGMRAAVSRLRIRRVLGLTCPLGRVGSRPPRPSRSRPRLPVAALVRVVPPRVVLRGPDSVQQLAVEIVAPDATVRDATRAAAFVSSDPKVAAVDASGTIAAQGDGTATITVRVGGQRGDACR